MGKVVKNSIVYVIGDLIPKAVGFLLIPVITSYLGPSEYGIVQSMLVLFSILVVIITFALERSLPRLYFDYATEEERKKFIGTVTLTSLVISILFILLMFALHKYVGKIYKTISFFPYFSLTMLYAFFFSLSVIPRSYYRIIGKSGTYMKIHLLQFFISIFIILYFIIYKKEGAEGMLKGYMWGSLILAPYFIYLLVKISTFTINWNMLRSSLLFSLPLLPSVISNWVLNLSDRVFIERYFSVTEVGIYSLSYQIAQIISTIAIAFFAAYSPFFYKMANSTEFTEKEKKKTLRKFNNAFLYVLVILSFLVSFFIEELLHLFFSEEYYEAASITPLIALSYLVSLSLGLLNLSIYQAKKTIAMMLSITGSALLNILLNYLLIPPLGIKGAAYATILSFLLFFILMYFYSKKCYHIPFKWLPLSLITSIGVVLFFVFRIYPIENIILSIVVKSCILGIVVGIFVYFNFDIIKEIINNQLGKNKNDKTETSTEENMELNQQNDM